MTSEEGDFGEWNCKAVAPSGIWAAWAASKGDDYDARLLGSVHL